jgi:hypothetical protein
MQFHCTRLRAAWETEAMESGLGCLFIYELQTIQKDSRAAMGFA